MAWEKRKGSLNRYYYRSVRQGNRVRKVYFGSGLAGKLAASMDAGVRGERKRRAAGVRESAEQYVAALEPLAALENALRALMVLSLHSAGYEYSRYKWRKRNAR